MIRIKKAVLVPLGIVLALLFVAAFMSIYTLQQKTFDTMVYKKVNSIERLFVQTLDFESKHLETLIRLYEDNPDLRQSFLARDRNNLYEAALPLFKRIRREHNITHFYIHTPDRTCFLRVHNPGRYGDIIERYTLIKAAENPAGTSISGIELGPLGTFTLRVVMPWFIDEKPAGFIEYGREIGHIAPLLHDITGMELIFVIDKDFLNRQDWEKGMEMLGRKADWNRLEKFIIASNTLPPLAKEKISEIARLQTEEMKKFIDADIHDVIYRGGIIPLYDAGGQEVGKMAALMDFSVYARQQRMFLWFSFLGAATGLFLFVVFGRYLGRVDDKLVDTHQKLAQEIERHKITGAELQKNKDELDELVAKRTAELEKTKKEVKILSGILPICAHCKKIRDKEGNWIQVESYVSKYSEARFSHGLCKECSRKCYPEFFKEE